VANAQELIQITRVPFSCFIDKLQLNATHFKF